MERRSIPPIRSEYEFAPTDKDRLASLLGGFFCSRSVDCRIQNCHQDRHHMVYGQDLSDPETMMKSHPDMIEPICRWKHQQVHRTWDRSEPISDDFAVGYLLANPQNLGANQRKRLKELRKGLWSGQRNTMGQIASSGKTLLASCQGTTNALSSVHKGNYQG